MMERGIDFAAGGRGTGMYLALSEYYDTASPTRVTILDQFDLFCVRGNLNCYSKAHNLNVSTVLNDLTDTALPNWGCSTHEIFIGYPPPTPLASALDFEDPCNATYPDRTTGVPYIAARDTQPICERCCKLPEGYN